MATNNESWKGKTGGGNLGQRALFYFFHVGNISLAYGLMGFAIFFYLLVNYKATLNIYSYFRERQHYGAFKSAISTYKNHFLFGKTVIDKFAFFSGRKDEYLVEKIGNERFLQLDSNHDSGVVMLHSHVGSSEIAGYMFSGNIKTINSIVFGGESPVYQKYRSGLFSQSNIRLIAVNDALTHVFEVNNALRNKETVSMAADRVYENSKSIIVEILGAKAKLPIGPFQLAYKLNVPVLAFFVMQSGYKKYCCHVLSIDRDDSNITTAKQGIQLLADRYAAELEKILLQYPLQWYNFHKFWI